MSSPRKGKMLWQRIPLIPKLLPELLSEKYPDALPRKQDFSVAQLARLQGQQDVIDYLKTVIEKQDKAI